MKKKPHRAASTYERRTCALDTRRILRPWLRSIPLSLLPRHSFLFDIFDHFGNPIAFDRENFLLFTQRFLLFLQLHGNYTMCEASTFAPWLRLTLSVYVRPRRPQFLSLFFQFLSKKRASREKRPSAVSSRKKRDF